MAYYVLMCR